MCILSAQHKTGSLSPQSHIECRALVMAQPAGQATRHERLSATLATRPNDVLLQQVHQDRVQRRERAEQLAAFEELMEDNHILQTAVLSYRKQRHLTMNILDRTLEALCTVRAALEHCTDKRKTSDTKEVDKNAGGNSSGGWL